MISEGLVYPVETVLAQDTLEGDMKLGDKLVKSGLSMGEFNGEHYMLPSPSLPQRLTMTKNSSKITESVRNTTLLKISTKCVTRLPQR